MINKTSKKTNEILNKKREKAVTYGDYVELINQAGQGRSILLKTIKRLNERLEGGWSDWDRSWDRDWDRD